jgi:hypothetical protein
VRVWPFAVVSHSCTIPLHHRKSVSFYPASQNGEQTQNPPYRPAHKQGQHRQNRVSNGKENEKPYSNLQTKLAQTRVEKKRQSFVQGIGFLHFLIALLDFQVQMSLSRHFVG